MPPSQPIRFVLLVQSGALGDTVIQLRMAEAFRRACPGAHITWLGRDAWLPLAQRCPFVDEALGLDAMRSHRLFQEDLPTDPDLAGLLGRSDLIINGLSAADSPMMEHLRRMTRQLATCYDPRPRADSHEHACRQWLWQVAGQVAPRFPAVAGALRAYSESVLNEPGWLLSMQPDDLGPAQDRLAAVSIDPAGVSGRLVLLHPGSGGLRKCYGLDRFLDLYRLLLQRQMRPLLLAGPAELERWGERLSSLPREFAVLAEPDLPVLISLCTLAAAYIGNDAGPTHVAAAAGARTVALFGPSDPHVWRPLGPHVTVLQSREYERGWGDLPVEQVAERVLSVR